MAIEVSVEEILINQELQARAVRPALLEEENAALHRFMHCFAGNSENLLQELVQTGMELCGADSAGISLEETLPDGTEIFRWIVAAGQIANLRGETMPRHDSPCGLVVDRGGPQLFSRPGRFYSQVNGLPVEFVEGLLIPWKVEGLAVGTVWVLAHTEGKKFDQEDLRLISSLAAFTAIATRVGKMEESQRELESFSAAAKIANRLAHELNNPLQALTNSLHLLEFAPSAKLVQTAQLQLDRVSTLVKSILNLNRASVTSAD